jgi:hypothetical protein
MKRANAHAPPFSFDGIKITEGNILVFYKGKGGIDRGRNSPTCHFKEKI